MDQNERRGLRGNRKVRIQGIEGAGRERRGGRYQFKKITPYNGFDSNADNGRQNNYAWSMAEMGDYIYVGTGRNIVYSVFKGGLIGGLPVPEAFVPQQVDMNGEIWRYKKDGAKGWQRVYKAPPELGITGLRFMIRYTSPVSGETALYAGCATIRPGILVLRSTDGVNWSPLNTGITKGSSTRSMVIHNGKLYMAVLSGSELVVTEPLLYVTTDPMQGWQEIDIKGAPDKNPRGNSLAMLSYNGYLYMGTARPGGFEVWRTRGAEPAKDDWKLVVDKGAGDALNEVPVYFGTFKGYIYVGTALYFGFFSLNPEHRYVPPKGFDVIRIDKNDKWELVVGGAPIIPTQPVTGTRGEALSRQPSGFGDISNGYCWQIQAQGDELYLGTWDWSDLIPPILSSLQGHHPITLKTMALPC